MSVTAFKPDSFSNGDIRKLYQLTLGATQKTFESQVSIADLDSQVNTFIGDTKFLIHQSSFAIGVKFYTTIAYKEYPEE